MCEKIMHFTKSTEEIIYSFYTFDEKKELAISADTYRYLFLEINKIIYLRRDDSAYDMLRCADSEINYILEFTRKCALKIMQHTHYFYDLAHILRLHGISPKYSDILYIGGMKNAKIPYIWLSISLSPNIGAALFDIREYAEKIKKEFMHNCHIHGDALLLYIT